MTIVNHLTMVMPVGPNQGLMMERVCELDLPIGSVLLAAHEGGLTHLLFLDEQGKPRRAGHRPARDASRAAARILDKAEIQLHEYLGGRRQSFDLPLALEGTPFQLTMWNGLREIPFGKTTSYGALARHLGCPKAARAIGAANGANPVSIIVPCHRVIGHDRSLIGYGGGMNVKKRLLELEGFSDVNGVRQDRL